MEKYGVDSWELDALEPRILADLINDEIEDLHNEQVWEAAISKETGYRKELHNAARILAKRSK